MQNGALRKDVGLVGCGFMGRRLLDLLKPFRCSVFVYDPYLPPEAADMLGFTQTTLEKVPTPANISVNDLARNVSISRRLFTLILAGVGHGDGRSDFTRAADARYG